MAFDDVDEENGLLKKNKQHIYRLGLFSVGRARHFRLVKQTLGLTL